MANKRKPGDLLAIAGGAPKVVKKQEEQIVVKEQKAKGNTININCLISKETKLWLMQFQHEQFGLNGKKNSYGEIFEEFLYHFKTGTDGDFYIRGAKTKGPKICITCQVSQETKVWLYKVQLDGLTKKGTKDSYGDIFEELIKFYQDCHM